MMSDFFEAFGPIDRPTWEALIEKELKGQAYATLRHELAGAALDPFYLAEEQAPAPSLPLPRTWHIGEPFDTDAHDANARVLEALNMGVDAPAFQVGPAAWAGFEAATAGVEMSWIRPHIEGLPPGAWGDFHAQLRQKAGAAAKDWHICYAAPIEALPGLRAELASSDWGMWRPFVLEGPDGQAVDGQALGAWLGRAAAALDTLIGAGLSAHDAFAKLWTRTHIGKDYFLAISQLRAMYLLWGRLAEAYGLAAQVPYLDVHFLAGAYDTADIHSNMIKASTMALSARLGGATRLSVLPADARQPGSSDPQFMRRIARNVQHLMQMESFMDKVSDPAAGSYYIERATQQLAASAWAALQSQA